MIFISSLDFLEISEGRRVKWFRKFPKGGGLNALGNFRREEGSMLSEISEGRRVKPPSEIYRPGDLLPLHSNVFLRNMRCFWDSVCVNKKILSRDWIICHHA